MNYAMDQEKLLNIIKNLQQELNQLTNAISSSNSGAGRIDQDLLLEKLRKTYDEILRTSSNERELPDSKPPVSPDVSHPEETLLTSEIDEEIQQLNADLL